MDVLLRRALGLLALCLAGGFARQGRAAEAPDTARACMIRGPGELMVRDQDGRHQNDARPFRVFAGPARAMQVAEVARGDTVPVTWSRLPIAGRGELAHVHLASDGLQLAGWATLRDRLFQLEERADVVVDRLWARRGAPVRIVGVREQLLAVHVETSPATMVSPQRIDLETACGNLAYQPTRFPLVADGAPRGSGVANPTTGSLTLSAEPGEASFLRVVLPREHRISLVVTETRERWVRIAGEDSVIGLNAWVPAWQVTITDGGVGFGSMRGSTRHQPPRRAPQVGRARRDAVVSLGAAAPVVAIGVLLAGTRVRLEGFVDRADAVPFTLAGQNVRPPPGQRFWVSIADIEDLGEADLQPDPLR
ncbi:MAG: hypothetical protein WKG00_39220 [Polyangiaceae bacterium]